MPGRNGKTEILSASVFTARYGENNGKLCLCVERRGGAHDPENDIVLTEESKPKVVKELKRMASWLEEVKL